MGKKKIVFLVVFFMALSILVPRLDVNAATSDLQILFNNNGNTATSNNTINANFKVVNNGTSSINLADLKFRYYYTADSDKAQNFFCDHAGMMNGWSYTGVTDKVTGTFVKMDATNPKADTYFEVGFKSDAGTLSAGGYIEIQTRVARNDWTNYDLSNDYSFKTLSTYGDNDRITAYLGGILIYGQGITTKPLFDATIGTATGIPGDTVTVAVSFKNVAKAGNVGTCQFYIGYDNTLLEAISVVPGAIVQNPVNNFSSKIDSTKGVISFVFLDNTIGDELIKTDGDFALITFKIKSTATDTTTPVKFNDDGAYALPTATLKSMANTTNGSITIKSPQIVAPTITPSRATFNTVNTSGLRVILTPNGNVFKGITGLTKGVDYTVSGNAVTILENYLNMLSTGTRVLTFDFGVPDNPVFTITKLDCCSYINVKIGTVNAAIGDTVIVPVTVSNVRSSVGSIGVFNFYIGYDKTLLEALSVEPGDVIKNPDNNFSSKIYFNNGTISVVFIDNTMGDELITSDGEIVNITFKVLKTVDATIPIVFKEGGAFGDGDSAKITRIDVDNGGINVDKTDLFGLSVGKITGKEGEMVAVPISFENVAKMGNVLSCDFKVNYNTNLLEAVSVEPGSIVTNAEANFSSYISTTSGAISFVFAGSTAEGQTINKDGVFANINFKLKNPTYTQDITPIQIKEIGAIIDLDLNKMPILKTDGSVTIIRTINPDPKIYTSTKSLVLGSAGDLKITLNKNGNTFNGISGLMAGTDYLVAGSTVTILKSYMNSLEVGIKKFTFDFGVGDKNPVIEIEVKAGTVTEPNIDITNTIFEKHNPANVKITLIPNGNVLKV